MSKRKVCVVTGSRAEYGLLTSVMRALQSDSEFELQVLVTGMHLVPEFGNTWQVIERDGFKIDAKVEMLSDRDDGFGIAKSIGLGTIGIADALERLSPDLLLILGDRFEILAAAQVALVAKIPVAHLIGGDVTEGAFDDAIRHSLTKMSHLHFVTHERAAAVVRQLGESPENIFVVGNPGLDQIRALKLLTRAELEAKLDFKLRQKNLLITFHPVTLDRESSCSQFEELLSALELEGKDTGLIFTRPNADPEGRELIQILDRFVEKHDNAVSFASLGQLAYLSAMSQVNAVVGNSSSGLLEAPSFKIPTINIGDRQKGRLQAASVINCLPKKADINQAIQKAYATDCSQTVNPYGDGLAAQKIISILKRSGDFRNLLKKRFVVMESA